MKLRESVNEHGVPVSHHRCPDCGNEFTVTPAAGDDWGGCQADACMSYDPKRDAEIFMGYKPARRTDH